MVPQQVGYIGFEALPFRFSSVNETKFEMIQQRCESSLAVVAASCLMPGAMPIFIFHLQGLVAHTLFVWPPHPGSAPYQSQLEDSFLPFFFLRKSFVFIFVCFVLFYSGFILMYLQT